MRFWRAHTSPLTLAALVVALLWTACVAHRHVEGLSGPLDRFEEVCLDLRFILTGRRAPPRDVIVVAIDDATIGLLGAYPLPRQALARIVAAVARQKPRAIAVDLLFLDHGPPDADAALAEALKSAPATIAAAGLFGADPANERRTLGGAFDLVPQPSGILMPVEPMASAADAGLVNLTTGFGGTPRHMPLLFRGADGGAFSFVLLAAALASGRTPRFVQDGVWLGGSYQALDLGKALALRFYGPRGTIPSVSAETLLGPAPPDLANRIVVIGATATGAGDAFPTPFSSVVPGTEIFATAIDNLVNGEGLIRTRWVRWLDALAATVLALTAVALIAMRRTIVGLGLVLVLGVVWALLTWLAFAQGYWFSTTLPLAAMVPVAVLYGAARLWRERRVASRLAEVERALRPFQARPLSDLVSKDPAFLAEPLIRDVAIIFADLAGYTGLSEATDPVRVRDLLKSFHALVDAVVDHHGGLVTTFMGDGVMIMFGFPEAHPDDAARALEALAALEPQLRDWGDVGTTGLDRPIETRLSAHYGPVVVSRLGGDSHAQITATGDTVNVASRLIELAKVNGVCVVITDDIFRAAGTEAPSALFAEPVDMAIRGRSNPVAVRLPKRVEA